MPLKDLSGKTAYELDREDFEKLFCRCCKDFYKCAKDDGDIELCKPLIDSGLWDKFYRKN